MKRPVNTDQLWDAIMLMISTLLILVVVLMLYIPLEATIARFLSRPKIDQSELREIAQKRQASISKNMDLVENGIHMQTGLVYDTHFNLVKSACTSCHSAKLIIQNKADRAGWKQMIHWMYETQGLPDLGEQDETAILDYLSKNYAPVDLGRRATLELAESDWYQLEL